MIITVIQNGQPLTMDDVTFVEIRAKETISFEAVAENDVQVWKTEEETE